jgi:hypothetical protein
MEVVVLPLFIPFVIIYYWNIMSIPIYPSEANAPLGVYTNAILPFSVTLQCLKTVARGQA